MKTSWPTIIKKDMTPAKRHKMKMNNLRDEKIRRERRAIAADLLAEERSRPAREKEKANAMAETRRRLMELNPGKTVRMSVNAKGTIQARVGGKFVKVEI